MKIGEDWTCSFRNILADKEKHADRQTDRQTRYRGAVSLSAVLRTPILRDRRHARQKRIS